MTFELDTEREELLGVGLLPRRDGARNEPEGDHSRARAEAAFARYSADELEASALDGREQSEGLHTEVRFVDLAVSLLDLDLVPEIQRGGDAVEAGPMFAVVAGARTWIFMRRRPGL